MEFVFGFGFGATFIYLSYFLITICFRLYFQDSTDLIELDSSLSFEVDDFDPLNQNAKQLPPLPKKPPVVFIPQKAPTVPPNPRQAFDNPLYPHFTPPCLRQPSKPMTTSSNSTNNSDDDVVKLFREYGLHNLIEKSLRNSTPHDATTNNRTNDSILDNGMTGLNRNSDFGQPKTNNNWTTFD